jgi:16S rRNA (cytidine1402-2'-O)-methyltransferase
MIYLVSTPIGNLKDITERAVQTLASCDYILCEDTRRTRILLDHYGIKTKLKSFHKFSESKKQDQILEELHGGKQLALVSDAGTPGIADPGVGLVMACQSANIPVISIPGPCALISALSISGFPTHRFQFVGFLPKKSGQLKSLLEEIFSYPGTTVCYESPYRILKVLQAVHDLNPTRKIAIARELTKKFEEVLQGTAKELIDHFQKKPPKGEFVIIF